MSALFQPIIKAVRKAKGISRNPLADTPDIAPRYEEGNDDTTGE